MKLFYTKVLPLLYLLWSGAFLSGCSSPAVHESGVISVDLTGELSDATEFFDDWSFVVLNTSNGEEEGIIGTISNIAIDDKNIVIKSMESDNILVYDRKGNLKTTFNRRGQGPHEYIDLNRIKLVDGSIWILGKLSRKLIEYDTSGNYIKHYNLPDFFGDFEFIGDGKVILDSDYGNKLKHNIIVYDFKNDSILGMTIPFELKKGMGRGVVSSSFLSSDADKMYISQLFDNNVYELTSDSTAEICFTYDFNSEFKVSDEDLKNKSKVELYDMTAGKHYVRWLGPAFFTDDVFYQYLDCNPRYIYKHNRKTGEGALVKIKRYPEFPFLCSAALAFYDGNYVSVVPPADIEYIEGEIGKKLITDSVDLSDDSNPILFFHHFKR